MNRKKNDFINNKKYVCHNEIRKYRIERKNETKKNR